MVRMEKRIENLERMVDEIRSNHLAHIATDITELKTNQSWLLRYHWITATAAIGGLITGLFNLMK